MQQYQFNTTIEKGMINIPADILKNLSSNINVIIQNKDKNNSYSDITFASEKVLAADWLLPEEDLVWQNL